MISLQKVDNAIKFTFTDSQHYLYGDGVIAVPVNSLLLVEDKSDAVTFKKIDGDVFVSAPVAEFGMSKAEIEAFYKENMVGSTGGGDITSGEVQTMIDESISGKADTSAVTAVNDVLTAHTANTTVHVTVGDKLTWDGKQDALTAGTGIDITNDVISCTVTGGGNNVVELTQAQYDALVDKDPDAFYIITDAPAIDLSGYAQTSAVTAEITAAVSGKQDTLSAGTGIDITNNVISATGGGSTYSAGTNISIANDTINCTLPIGMTYGYESIKSDRASVRGHRNIAWGLNAYVGALGSSYTPEDAFAFGGNVKVYNSNEASFGRYNASVQNTQSGGDSGTTLFSVGNGTSRARHNAFEIRQNGDIYISKDGQDVKLQDQLGGAASSAITSGDTNAVAGGAVYDKFDEVEQVTAAALNALNDNFGGLKLVKLTQAEYSAMATKDNNTLYLIVN